mmetsp:Transcript_8046/g.27337  ORF Transcript_8046/g.27337 Transcript_8046/m.27337 type:complete len:339 (-) Transcript_8046:660-1676(-)
MPPRVLHLEALDDEGGPGDYLDHQGPVQAQRAHLHLVAVDHERGPRGDVHLVRDQEPGPELGHPGGEGRGEDHAGAQVHGDAREGRLCRGLHGAPGVAQHGGVGMVERALRGRGRHGWDAARREVRRGLEAVLDGVVAKGGGQGGVGHLGVLVGILEDEGEVLHEHLEARGRLEALQALAIGALLELWVDELREAPLGGGQRGHIAREPKHKLINIARVGRVARGRVVGVDAHVGAGEKGLKLVVLHGGEHRPAGAIAVLEGAHGAHRLARAPRDAHRVEVEPLHRGHAQGGQEGGQVEGVGVLEEGHPVAPLGEPALRQLGRVEQVVHVPVAVRLGN